jgi:hypothetical protein
LRWNALRRLVENDEVLAGLRVRSVEDRSQLLVVVRGEAVETQMIAALDVRPALRNLLRGDPRDEASRPPDLLMVSDGRLSRRQSSLLPSRGGET